MKDMLRLRLQFEGVDIVCSYPRDHVIWTLDPQKQERQAIADTIRRLTIKADELVKEQVVIRG